MKWTEQDVIDTVKLAMMPQEQKPIGVKDLLDKNSFLLKNNYKNKSAMQDKSVNKTNIPQEIKQPNIPMKK